jgi:hypothetical protein
LTGAGDLAGVPKPLFGGCFGVFVGGAVLLAAVVFLFIFLDSGANTGRMVLRHADSYAPGTVEFVGERNFFVVRLADGEFLALSDLDAANRSAQGQRCRVAPMAVSDPRLPELLEKHRSAMSPAARGATLLFREECNGAMYDLTGLRLDADERNLDRYETSVDGEGHLVVDVSRRICTEARGGEFFAEVRC